MRVYNGSTWQAASTVGGTVTSLSVTGATTLGQNLAFTGTGNRITGDFSNATIANRVAFQNSVSASTVVHAYPGGAGTTGGFEANNNSDPTNSAALQMFAGAADASVRSSIRGTGTYLPMSFYTGGTERARIAADGAQSSVIPGGTTLYPESKCRAWVNFDGTGTVAIRASGNVSSISDDGTGTYTVNFATAMPDADYALAGATALDGSETGVRVIGINKRTGASGKTTTSCAIQVRYATTLNDQSVVDCVFFR
jgi:hypothetical protein